MNKASHPYVSVAPEVGRSSIISIDRPPFLTEAQMKTTLWTARMDLTGALTLSPGSFGAKFREPNNKNPRWTMNVVIQGSVEPHLATFFHVRDVDTITGGTVRLGLQVLRPIRRPQRGPREVPAAPLTIDVSALKAARDLLNREKKRLGDQMEMSVSAEGLLSVNVMVSL